jgi:hypothetical protein
VELRCVEDEYRRAGGIRGICVYERRRREMSQSEVRWCDMFRKDFSSMSEVYRSEDKGVHNASTQTSLSDCGYNVQMTFCLCSKESVE